MLFHQYVRRNKIMIIIREDCLTVFSIISSYHVFNNAEEFEKYKEQIELLDLETSRKRSFCEISKTIMKEIPLDQLGSTTMKNFAKLMEIVKNT